MKRHFKCVVAYDGTNYYGWQKQGNFVTVQGLIEYCLEKMFGHKVKTMGASRTDAGVHAYGNVFAFTVVTPIEAKGVKSMLNSLLPEDIRIISAEEGDEFFHPRANVRRKFYRYVIYSATIPYPFYRHHAWHLDEKLDVRKMREVLEVFKGVKNYYSFSASGSPAKSYERSFDSIKIKKEGKFIIMDFQGKAFLYRMIRRVTACIVKYALGGITKQEIEKMFVTQDRQIMRDTAPGEGLYLVKIIYKKGKAAVEEIDEEEQES